MIGDELLDLSGSAVHLEMKQGNAVSRIGDRLGSPDGNAFQLERVWR
jgi:hypothetical protein